MPAREGTYGLLAEGLFTVLFFLFVRFVPMIPMSELRILLPQAKIRPERDAVHEAGD